MPTAFEVKRIQALLAQMRGNVPACYYETRTAGVWQAEEYGRAKTVRARYEAVGFQVVGTEQDFMGDDLYTLIRFRLPAPTISPERAYFEQFMGDSD